MLILLPPSESKTGRSRGNPLALDRLQLPGLTGPRGAVVRALAAASARPDAASVLGVSTGLADQIAWNLRLCEAPATPVAALYTGVLYDALDLPSLDAAARRRASRQILIQSALFGALRLTDKVPPYRLSMAVNLPGLGPLARFWRAPLHECLDPVAGRQVIVDCRSSTYAAAWAPPARHWVQVRVPGASHMAKHTRGLVARHLAQHDGAIRSPGELADVVSEAFDAQLTPPERDGRPWVLDVPAP